MHHYLDHIKYSYCIGTANNEKQRAGSRKKDHSHNTVEICVYYSICCTYVQWVNLLCRHNSDFLVRPVLMVTEYTTVKSIPLRNSMHTMRTIEFYFTVDYCAEISTRVPPSYIYYCRPLLLHYTSILLLNVS